MRAVAEPDAHEGFDRLLLQKFHPPLEPVLDAGLPARGALLDDGHAGVGVHLHDVALVKLQAHEGA